MRFPRRFPSLILGLLVAAAPLGTSSAQSSVDVEIEQFGLGYFRAGGVVPIRVRLTSNLPDARAVWVQWQVPNADGDVGEYGRSLTLSAGQTASTWLYAPIAPNDTASSVWSVRVFEERDGERRGELGGRRFSPSITNAQQVDLAAGMMAVIGERRLGLDGYTSMSNFRIPRPISGHEDTRVASGLRPSGLPDRWYGLMAFEAIAWAGDNVPPQDLSIDQADALREYVQRGGHLIIALPAAGNPWGLGALGATQIEDLLPCRSVGTTPRRDEGVPLSALLPVLHKSTDLTRLIGTRTEPQFAIRVFKDLRGSADGGFNVIDNGYEPLLALPDGRVIAIQKRVGFGRVTVVGIDLADGRLASLGLPQADVFWSRVLGRRADTPTLNEIQAAEKAEALARSLGENDRNIAPGMLFAGSINMQSSAGIGLLMAFVLFIAYWMAAFVSFFALRHYRLERHSWLAFAGIACGFTLLAWGSVGIVPKSMEVQHITVLDHVARPPDSPAGEEQYQRAISFFSLYLPRYGFANVALARSGDLRDVLLPWSPPGETIQPFPNTDVFRVDVSRGFASINMPSRSTTTQMYANWMGGVDPNWGGLLRVDPRNPLRVVTNAAGDEVGLAGSIVNELPGTLRDPLILWVRNNRLANRRYQREVDSNNVPFEREWVALVNSGMMSNSGEALALPATFEWTTGVSIDLAAMSGPGTRSPLSTTITSRFISPYESTSAFAAPTTGSVSVVDQRRYLMMLSMFHQLDPPQYLKSTRETLSSRTVTTFRRDMARELDLSPWFTRPCVIILGFLENAPTPVPLRIDGSERPPISTGLTLVRWIYPLPLNEDIAFRTVSAESP